MNYKFSAQQVSDYLKPELNVSKSEVYRFTKALGFKFPLSLNQTIKIRRLKMKQKQKVIQNKIIYISGYRQCPTKADVILQMLPVDQIKYDKVLVIDNTSYMHLSDKILINYKIDDWEVEKVQKINSQIDFLCDRFFYLNEKKIIDKLQKYCEVYNKIIICVDKMTNMPFISNEHFVIYNPDNISSHLKKRPLKFKNEKTLKLTQGSNHTTRSIKSNAQGGIYETHINITNNRSLNLNLLEQKSLGRKIFLMIKDFIYHSDISDLDSLIKARF